MGNTRKRGGAKGEKAHAGKKEKKKTPAHHATTVSESARNVSFSGDEADQEHSSEVDSSPDPSPRKEGVRSRNLGRQSLNSDDETSNTKAEESKKHLRAKIHAPPHKRGLSPTIAALLLVSVVLVSGGVYIYNFVDVDITDVIDTVQKRFATVLGNEPDSESAFTTTSSPPADQIPTKPPTPTQSPNKDHTEEPGNKDNSEQLNEDRKIAREEEKKKEEIRKEEERIKREEMLKVEKKQQEDLMKEQEQRRKEEKRRQEEDLEREQEKRKKEEEQQKEDDLRKEQEKRREEEKRLKEEKQQKEDNLRKEQEKKKEQEEREKSEEHLEKEKKRRREEEQQKEDDRRKQQEIQKREEERKKEEDLKNAQEHKKLEEEKLQHEENLKNELEKKKLQEEKKNYAKASVTNDADYKIRNKLDEADILVGNKKPVEAIKSYEAILEKHPSSPRATYGIAWATDTQSEMERSNPLLEAAVDAYLKVLNLPDVPKELMLKAGRRCAERQKFRGWAHGAMKTLKRLLDLYPDDITLWNEFGVHCLLTGKNEDARITFKQILDKKPDDGFALVHMGFILKQIDQKYEESIPYLQKGIDSNAEGTIDGRFFFHLGDAYYRIGQHDRAYEVYELGAQKGVFYSKYQRSLYNVDGLTARPWWTAEQTGHAQMIKMLEDNWQIIRDEGLAQLDAKSGTFVPEEEDLRETGDWQQFTLYQQGRKIEKNCQKAPKTCALIDQFPEAKGCKRGQVKFSVMHPGVHVWPHCGPTNCRIRAHLGLAIPDGVRLRVTEETRTWKEGKVIIFDDSFEHEVWHEGTETRLVLIFDMWHPDLTSRQKATLTPI